MNAETIMTRNVHFVPPSLGLDLADLEMRKRRIRHLVIGDDGVVMGVLSDRDVLLRTNIVRGAPVVSNLPVGCVASSHVVLCTPETPIEELTETFLRLKTDVALVRDSSGRVVGLITETDLLGLLLADSQPGSRETCAEDEQGFWSDGGAGS